MASFSHCINNKRRLCLMKTAFSCSPIYTTTVEIENVFFFVIFWCLLFKNIVFILVCTQSSPLWWRRSEDELHLQRWCKSEQALSGSRLESGPGGKSFKIRFELNELWGVLARAYTTCRYTQRAHLFTGWYRVTSIVFGYKSALCQKAAWCRGRKTIGGMMWFCFIQIMEEDSNKANVEVH